MSFGGLDLHFTWFVLVGVLFTGYILLDGFDLGAIVAGRATRGIRVLAPFVADFCHQEFRPGFVLIAAIFPFILGRVSPSDAVRRADMLDAFERECPFA